ncbi:hypothetical protein ON010_g17494 [Phytophthora cinnamomi]|nr:hypothetical protein ON010_g17494 [Phytophthora cinnamomi]
MSSPTPSRNSLPSALALLMHPREMPVAHHAAEQRAGVDNVAGQPAQATEHLVRVAHVDAQPGHSAEHVVHAVPSVQHGAQLREGEVWLIPPSQAAFPI